MNARQATRFMFWAGEKMDAGDELTVEELQMMKDAKAASLATVQKFLRLTPEDWKYTSGEAFK